MKKIITVGLIGVVFQLGAHQPDDSLVRVRINQMKVVAEVWSQEFNDTFMCRRYCPTFDGRPAYLHDGTFPSGSEFDFMEADEREVLGPYITGNCIALYKYIGRRSMPDSVRFSQILVAYHGAKGAEPYVVRSREQARARADSLCFELRTQKIFMDEIMVMESDDVSGLIYNHGDYGWMTRKSKYPNSVKDVVFSQKAGSFVIAESERGFHVISIDEISHVWDCYAAWEIAWCIDSCYDLRGEPVTTAAEFPGGTYAMEEYFNSEKTKYDSLDLGGQFDFPVLVFFDVMPDGSATNVAVLQQYWVTPQVVRDITQLIKTMPKWKPAQACSGAVKEGQVVVIYL
jgi:hypothetical protein